MKLFSILRERGYSLSPNVLNRLVYVCQSTGDALGLEHVVSYVEREGIRPDSALGNTLASSLASVGEYTRAKAMYAYLTSQQLKVRSGTLNTLLEAALTRRDFSFITVLLREAMIVPSEAVSVSVLDVGDSRLVSELMKTYQKCEAMVGLKVAEHFIRWAKRFVADILISRNRLSQHSLSCCRQSPGYTVSDASLDNR